ncbi:MAG: hypothetical protein ACJ780_16210 [Solirubrobacteraceae bacterium]
MHVSDPQHPTPSVPIVLAPPASVPPAASAVAASSGDGPRPYEHCDECGSPVDVDQRYCVVCGAHRGHVQDPAASYLRRATARTRSARSSATTAGARHPAARGRSVGVALVLAVIPVAAAVGVAVGRSSNNDDTRLIQALARRQAATVTTAAVVPATRATTTAATRAAHTARTSTSRHRRRHRTGSTSSPRKAAKAVSSTRYGTVTQIAGSKPSKAQEQQGAQVTQKVQKSTGKSYVNQQSNLPGTVVVP